MDKLKISLSSEPPQNLEELVGYIKNLETDIDLVHFDIMDGIFVEKKSLDIKDVKFMRNLTTLPFDVHLMTAKPHTMIDAYSQCGINILTMHYEAFSSQNLLVSSLKKVRKNNILAGISIKPDTEIDALNCILPYVDVVLVMSVEPGKSGQIFLEETYNKIKKLIEYKASHNFLIEVDGGINPEISTKLKELGVDVIVSGNYIYSSKNKKESIKLLRNK